MPMYDQAKWYYILIRKGTLREFFHYKLLRYHINNIFGRIVLGYAKVYFDEYYHQVDVVLEFKIFCGQKKLNKLIMEAHLLGLEDELLIFERKGEK